MYLIILGIIVFIGALAVSASKRRVQCGSAFQEREK
jgi:hypothetical protein